MRSHSNQSDGNQENGGHKKQILKCEQCGLQFDKPSRLADHLARHKEGVVYDGGSNTQTKVTCVACNKTCATRAEYSRHVWDVHADKSVHVASGGTRNLTGGNISFF